MKTRFLFPLALSASFLAACSSGGSLGTSPDTPNTGGGGITASGDWCVVVQSLVNDQQAVADTLRGISANTVSGPDIATPEGWTMRQSLATTAVNAAEALIGDYAASRAGITDPAVVSDWDEMSQFYQDSVLAANQPILAAPDEATYTANNTGGGLTVAPTAAQLAAQTYIIAQCGYLTPTN